jgi:Tfp pilus assembly protein PilN
MIKINLIPAKERKKQKEMIYVLSAAFFLVLAFLLMAYVYARRLSAEHGLEAQIQEVQKESEGYQDKIKEIKDVQAKEADLKTLEKTMSQISENQRKVLVAVDQAADNLPQDVWLTRIEQKPEGGEFVITGEAASLDSAKEYFSRLKKRVKLLAGLDYTEVNMMGLSNTTKYRIQQFQITFSVLDPGT